MGIWVEIKHALNSTLGTEEFKSLDKLIKQYLEEHKSLAPSENIYKVIENSSGSIQVSAQTTSFKKIGNSFVANCNGSVKILATLSNGGLASAKFIVIKGAEPSYGKDNSITNQVLSLSASSQDFPVETGDINIEKGQTYSFHIGTIGERTTSAINCQQIAIGASVVDGSLIS